MCELLNYAVAQRTMAEQMRKIACIEASLRVK